MLNTKNRGIGGVLDTRCDLTTTLPWDSDMGPAGVPLRLPDHMASATPTRQRHPEEWEQSVTEMVLPHLALLTNF